MSISGPYRDGKQALQEQKVAIVARLRQNFLLKCISLIASVLLYFYVQAERNPTVTRPFSAAVVREDAPVGVDIEADATPVEVHVSGPKSVMDGIKDTDVRILADFKGMPTDRVTEQKVRTRYDIQGLPADRQQELTFDPVRPPRLSVQIFPYKAATLPITARFPNDAPAGFRYGSPVVRPAHLRVSGRMDWINRIDHLEANAMPDQSGASIDGDFPVQARDTQNNIVDGVTLMPSTVHVVVPLVEEPYSKIVSVSPSISDQPLPTYRLTDITVMPNQVKILGRPDNVNKIATLVTDPISVRDRMESATVKVGLVLPHGVTVYDVTGKSITHVLVQLSIRRSDVTVAPTNGTAASNPGPTHPAP